MRLAPSMVVISLSNAPAYLPNAYQLAQFADCMLSMDGAKALEPSSVMKAWASVVLPTDSLECFTLMVRT